MNNQKLVIGGVVLLLVIVVIAVVNKNQEKKKNLSYLNTQTKDPNEVNAIVVSDDENPSLTEKNKDKKLSLTILEPQKISVVTTSTVTIKGKTSPDAEVFVNDKELIADKQGGFTVDIEVVEGENEISVFANDSVGNMKEETITITYNP